MRLYPGDVFFRGQLFDRDRFVLRPVPGVLEALGQPLAIDIQTFGQQIGYLRKFRVFDALAAYNDVKGRFACLLYTSPSPRDS